MAARADPNVEVRAIMIACLMKHSWGRIRSTAPRESLDAYATRRGESWGQLADVSEQSNPPKGQHLHTPAPGLAPELLGFLARPNADIQVDQRLRTSFT